MGHLSEGCGANSPASRALRQSNHASNAHIGSYAQHDDTMRGRERIMSRPSVSRVASERPGPSNTSHPAFGDTTELRKSAQALIAPRHAQETAELKQQYAEEVDEPKRRHEEEVEEFISRASGMAPSLEAPNVSRAPTRKRAHSHVSPSNTPRHSALGAYDSPSKRPCQEESSNVSDPPPAMRSICIECSRDSRSSQPEHHCKGGPVCTKCVERGTPCVREGCKNTFGVKCDRLSKCPYTHVEEMLETFMSIEAQQSELSTALSRPLPGFALHFYFGGEPDLLGKPDDLHRSDDIRITEQNSPSALEDKVLLMGKPGSEGEALREECIGRQFAAIASLSRHIEKSAYIGSLKDLLALASFPNQGSSLSNLIEIYRACYRTHERLHDEAKGRRMTAAQRKGFVIEQYKRHRPSYNGPRLHANFAKSGASLGAPRSNTVRPQGTGAVCIAQSLVRSNNEPRHGYPSLGDYGRGDRDARDPQLGLDRYRTPGGARGDSSIYHRDSHAVGQSNYGDQYRRSYGGREDFSRLPSADPIGRDDRNSRYRR